MSAVFKGSKWVTGISRTKPLCHAALAQMRRGRTRQADPPAAEGPLLHLEIGPLPLSAELQGKNGHSCVRSPLQGPRDVGGLDVP